MSIDGLFNIGPASVQNHDLAATATPLGHLTNPIPQNTHSSDRGTFPPAKVVIPLQVDKVDVEGYPKVFEIIDLWTNFAKEQMNRKQTDVLRDSILVLCLLTQELKLPGEIFVCRNGEGEVRGLMKILEERSSLQIVSLVASPLCFGKGAGSSLLKKAEDIAKERGKVETHLRSTFSAVKFYHRLGYHVPMNGLTLDVKGRYVNRIGLLVDVDEQDLVKEIPS